MSNLSLYVHIPFCVRKCNYCDFLSASYDEETRQKYVDVLCREIIQRAEDFRDKKVDTIFFGGGTPSILTVEQIAKIMITIRQVFHILPEAEISMEMNPGTVDREKLKTYKKLGINRLSIGLQSADNEELRILGRIHTWETFLQTWEMVREAGFGNVNIDLMSALPGQSLESYGETLRKVLALRPEHISAYSLIVEEGTLFYEWFGEESEHVNRINKEGTEQQTGLGAGLTQQVDKIQDRYMEIRTKKLPDENTDRKMYELTKKLLEEQGYYRYEISNYALRGYECKHNIGYWKRKEYLGLGLGAASLLFMNPQIIYGAEKNAQQQDISGEKVINIRSSNSTDMDTYMKLGQDNEYFLKKQNKKCKSAEILRKEQDWTEELTELSSRDQMEEFMFLGLRMMEGVSAAEFEEQFGQSLQEAYGTQIAKLEKQGLLEFSKDTERYALTLKGIDVSNQVFVEFLN